MRSSWDIAVLGAGPAGGAAARIAADDGADVLLLDEQRRPGGQVWRVKSAARHFASDSPETRAGDAHRAALEQSKVTFRGETRLWHIERKKDIWVLHVLTLSGTAIYNARAVILAPGAREFVQPFPGWTVPGVFGLAGVTALIKSQQIPPGRRCVVAGSGPLAIYAAAEILRLGGEIAAIVTPNSRADWLWCLPALLANPFLAKRGAEWIAQLKRAGMPIFWRHLVTRTKGNEVLSALHVSRCTSEWAPTGAATEIPADTLCIGNGLLPNSEIAALAGLELHYDADCGGWIAPVGPHGQTVIPGLYLCGDGAGIRGATVASEQGERAGMAAARWLKGAPASSGSQRRSHRAEWLGLAMTGLSRPRRGLDSLTTPETIVCRCENLTRATLEAEIDAGAASVEALKSATRCGMGPCGGRYCLTSAARLIEMRQGAAPGTVSPPTTRPPLFPLPVAAIGTEFDYDDLPIPAPAPL